MHAMDGTAKDVRAWLKSIGVNASTIDYSPYLAGNSDSGTARYFASPKYGTPPRYIRAPSKNPMSMFHEGGHLATMKSLDDWLGRRNLLRLARLCRLSRKSNLYGFGSYLGLSAAAVSPQDSLTGNLALGIPVLTDGLVLADEGLASTRGLAALRRSKGFAAAAKALPRALGSFGTYAARPAAAIAAGALLVNGLPGFLRKAQG